MNRTSTLKRTKIARKTDAARLRTRRAAMVTTKPRTGSRRELIRQLDDEVRRIVRARDGSCVTPNDWGGCFGPLEVSHYQRRGYQQLRWHLQNVHLQCQKHNQLHNTIRVPYYRFMIKKYGLNIVDVLVGWAHGHSKLSDADLQNLLAELRAA